MQLSERINHFFFKEVSASTLGFLRIMMGLFMLLDFHGFHLYFSGELVHSKFFFTYDGFHWISIFPEYLIDISFYVYYIATISFVLGIRYKLSSFIMFLGYTHVFLVDRGHYNNHYYMFSMLLFFFFISNADRWGSITKTEKKTIPNWQLAIFKFQIFIVYFFGAISKIQGDWLSGFPMRFWLYDISPNMLSFIQPFFQSEVGAIFFSYSGLLFDLFIGFMLFSVRWRRIALLSILFFHGMNHFMWNIGSFPFVMLSATVLFFHPDCVNKSYEYLKSKNRLVVSLFIGSFLTFLVAFYLKIDSWKIVSSLLITLALFFMGIQSPKVIFSWLFSFKKTNKETETVVYNYSNRKLILGFISVWCLFQIIFPFRHWMYNGNPSWTGEGHFFSWRMMLVGTVDAVKIKALVPETGEEFVIALEEYLTWRQFRKSMRTPKGLLRFVHFIRDEMKAKGGVENPIIKMEIWKSINERKIKLLNDTTLNYAEVPYTSVAPVDWMTDWKESDEIPTFDMDKYKAWRGFLQEQDSINAAESFYN